MAELTKSGDGERAAMLGYVPQYGIAASLIYDALLEGCFESIRVADPDAGSIDDIQIVTTGRLDAYQVKWAEYTGAISFSDFVRDGVTSAGEVKHSLFMQLVEGWKKFANLYPEKEVLVHLAHKKVPSASTKANIPTGDPAPKNPHFQSFLKDCWLDRSWCKSGIDSAPYCWKEALLDLRKRSGLGEDEFLLFISCCELEFNYKSPNELPATTLQQVRRQNDIDKIYALLTKMAGGERRVIEATKDDLLDRLSWNNRFKHKFVHEFPVDRTYQEITQTVSDLSTLLDGKEQGYIALLGSPGSGKSTTLTHTLKYRKGYKLIRYYAYVPDSTHQGRGEATTFLHDITLSLRHHGFRGSISQPGSREEYLSLLGEQLHAASDKWNNDGVLTIVMVDGLDHIQREQNPLQSLLSDLPPPHTIPKGVLFLLGSQTLELNDLSDAVKVHIESENRSIVISSLTRPNVYSAINEWPGCSDLTNDEKKFIYEKSSGHPLSLVYLLQLVAENPEQSCIELLKDFPDYEGHIEQNYLVYWKSIENNQCLVDLLALLSRMRIPINTNDLEKWFDSSTIKDFISSAAHYFKKDSGVNWRFFHNSFRQFILDKTGRNAFGKIDAEKHVGYHQKLSEYCSGSESDSPMRWERAFHLFNAGEMAAVIELGQQEYLRSQFFSLRNFENIIDDINYVLLAAKELGEPLPILRCLLIESELRERENAIEQIDVLTLLFSVEGIDSALNYIFDSELLSGNEREALKFSKVLIENDHVNEARRVFDASEPLDYLSGAEGVDTSYGGDETVRAWVDVAHNFISIENLVDTVYQTRYKNDRQQGHFMEDDDLHYRLIRRLSKSIYASKDAEKIEELFLYFDKHELENHRLELCFSICTSQFPPELTFDAFQKIKRWGSKERENLNASDRLMLAEFEFRIESDIEEAQGWLDGVCQPNLYKHGINGQWKNLSPFVDRIRFNRLSTALGAEVDPVRAVPDAEDKQYVGNVLFERRLVRFSNIWGKSWRGELVDPSTIVKEAKLSFDLLRRGYDQTSDWLGWYEFQSAAIDFFKFIIKAASQHGDDCVSALADSFRKHWEGCYWPTDWRREVSFALYEAGDQRDCLVTVLSEIETQIPDHEEVHARISEYAELAIVWSKIGEPDRASELLPKIFEGSFGIYHRKDRQFSHWVSWLRELVKQYPDFAEEEIGIFSSALVSLELSGNGRGTQEAARDLVAIATTWNVEYGLTLIKWLFDQKGLHYVSGLTGFLSGMLNRDNAPYEEISMAACKLLIPFEEYNPSDFPELLAYKLHAESGQNAEQQIEQVVASVQTHLLPSNRYSWLKAISDGRKKTGQEDSLCAAMAMETPHNTHVTHEPSLKLKTDEQLTSDEAQLKVSSIDGLLQLVNDVESVDHFRWLDLVNPYLKGMDVNQLEELSNLLKKFSPANNVVSAIASAFVDIGEPDKAHVLIDGLLEGSDPQGWDLHWDGGSRQSIFRTLVKINAEEWRLKALQCLVDDYISGYRNPTGLIWNFEEIVEIIFEDNDVSSLWPEIKNHVYHLDAFEVSSEKPPAKIISNDSLSDADFLIQFTFEMFDLITPELAYMAHQAIIGYSKKAANEAAICREIKSRIHTIGLVQIKIISLLIGLVDEHKRLVANFENEISALCISEDFSARLLALKLARILDIEEDFSSDVRSKLPFAYELKLPKIDNRSEAIPFSAMRPGETFPDINDPLELLRPLLTEASLIGKMTDVPFENIVYRASELMKSLAPENSWNKEAEDSYRRWIEGIELKLTYHRPRPQIARLALSHVVSELLDAGRISKSDTLLLSSLFMRADSFLLGVEPSLRPKYIDVPDGHQRNHSYKHDEWISDIEEAFPLFVNQVADGIIPLGELTNWMRLDWDTPKETRMSMVCHSEWPSMSDIKYPSSFFPNMMHWCASEYPQISDADQPSLVIHGSSSYIDHGGIDWLALNPTVGLSLGWSISSNGLFRWVNHRGETMVESLYWKDGPMARQPPKMDDICSDGWLVIASMEAVSEIRKVTGEAIKIDSVIRSYGRNPYDRTMSVADKRAEW